MKASSRALERVTSRLGGTRSQTVGEIMQYDADREFLRFCNIGSESMSRKTSSV